MDYAVESATMPEPKPALKVEDIEEGANPKKKQFLLKSLADAKSGKTSAEGDAMKRRMSAQG